MKSMEDMKDDYSTDSKKISISNYGDKYDSSLRSINLVMLASVLNPLSFSKFSTDSK